MGRPVVVDGPAVVITNPYHVRILLAGLTSAGFDGTPEHRELVDALARLVAAQRNTAQLVTPAHVVPSPELAEHLAGRGFAGVDWLTAERVAEMAGVSEQYVRRCAGRLCGRKVDGRWQIPADRAEEFAMRTKKTREAA